jgi:regulator of protease activity HflC (stomatin/prohibitin superfamily)
MKRLFLSFALALSALCLGACTQIDTGNVGVESALGQVKNETLPPGMYFSAFKRITEVCAKELPMAVNDLKPQTSDKIALADLDVDLYVNIDPSKAANIMTKWPGDLTDIKGGGCEAVGMNFVTRQARGAIYDVVSKHNSATIHTERSSLESETVKALQASLDADAGKGLFVVKTVNVRNLQTDPALEANIKAAAAAQFQLQAEKNQLENAKIVAERQRVQAQGEADAIRIKAEAVAKQGGAEYVQLQAIAKWDGRLPTTQAAGAVPFINVK